jgi:hypothetical protein
VAYQGFLHEAIPEGEWALIRESLRRGQLTGTQRFVDEVARIAGRKVEFRRPGRPPLSRGGDGGQDPENKSVPVFPFTVAFAGRFWAAGPRGRGYCVLF